MSVAQAYPLPAASGLFGPAGGIVDIAGLVGIETGGSATASVVIRQGSSTGKILATLNVAISGTDTKTFNHPVRCNGQMYAVLGGSGVVVGSVHII